MNRQTAARITRTGRDWIAPAHMSDWQRDRAEGPLLPMDSEGVSVSRGLFYGLLICAAGWGALAGLLL